MIYLDLEKFVKNCDEGNHALSNYDRYCAFNSLASIYAS